MIRVRVVRFLAKAPIPSRQSDHEFLPDDGYGESIGRKRNGLIFRLIKFDHRVQVHKILLVLESQEQTVVYVPRNVLKC